MFKKEFIDLRYEEASELQKYEIRYSEVYDNYREVFIKNSDVEDKKSYEIIYESMVKKQINTAEQNKLD